MIKANNQSGNVLLPLMVTMAAMSIAGAMITKRTNTQMKAIQWSEEKQERLIAENLLRQSISCPDTFARVCVKGQGLAFYDPKGKKLKLGFIETVEAPLDGAYYSELGDQLARENTVVHSARLKVKPVWGVKLHCNLPGQEIEAVIGKLIRSGSKELMPNVMGRPGKYHPLVGGPLCGPQDLQDRLHCQKGIQSVDFGRKIIECKDR